MRERGVPYDGGTERARFRRGTSAANSYLKLYQPRATISRFTESI